MTRRSPFSRFILNAGRLWNSKACERGFSSKRTRKGHVTRCTWTSYIKVLLQLQKMWRCSWKISFSWKYKIEDPWTLVKNILKQPCRISLYVSVKFMESTQWYKIFYVATAIATAVYSKNMTKNTDYFKHILTIPCNKAVKRCTTRLV